MSAVRPGYNQTEVGVIPEEWGVEPIGALIGALDAGVSVRSIPGEDENAPHEAKVLKTSCIGSGRFFPYEAKPVVPEDISRVKTPVRADTILISRMNTPDLVGEVGYVEADHPDLFLPDRLWMAGTASGRKTNMRWLTAMLAYGDPGQALRETATGTSGSMKNISKPALRGVLMPVPKPPEQQAIAEVLGDTDGLIKALEALIAKKRKIKQGAMQDLLTSQRRLPGFEGEWNELNLAKHSHLKARIGWQGLTTEEYLPTGDFYLVTGTDFVDGRVHWETCCFVERERYLQDPNIQLRNHDVLLTKDGTIGKVGYVDQLPGPATLNSGVFVIRPKDTSYVPLFAYYVLQSSIFTDFLNKLQAGSTIVHLYQKDFVSFQFPAPAPDEQRAIATVLLDMDAEIAALEDRLVKAQAVKQGMMQVLLTGEIRLV